jgi:hypothetical protein
MDLGTGDLDYFGYLGTEVENVLCELCCVLIAKKALYVLDALLKGCQGLF